MYVLSANSFVAGAASDGRESICISTYANLALLGAPWSELALESFFPH